MKANLTASANETEKIHIAGQLDKVYSQGGLFWVKIIKGSFSPKIEVFLKGY